MALRSDAHRIEYYTNNGCLVSGQAYTVNAYVVAAPSNTYYRWQYKDNNNVWTCLNNGNNTINGTVFSVSNVSGTGANSAPNLTFSSPGAALDNVQLRCLMRENASPCNAPSGTTWGGDDLGMSEVKILRLRFNGTAAVCGTACEDNLLVSSSVFYGGFEAVSYNSSNQSFTDNNFTSGRGSSDYSSSGTSGGNYTCINNPYATGYSLNSASFAPHSGNYQMVVNGNTTASARIWYKTISVQPGQTYTFSAWVGKVNNSTQPTIQLKAGNVELTSGTITGAIGKWTNFSGTYAVPPGVTQITFAILNKNGTACDFTLDDICVVKTDDPVTIGDKVWFDVNRNGAQDANEPGVSGSIVKLYYDGDGNGVADSTNPTYIDTTNSSGAYAFTGVIPGKYFVKFSVPSGYSGFTTQDAPGVPVGQNSTANVNSGQTGTHTFTADYLLKDAGLVKDLTLSGNLYKDTNGLLDNIVNGTGIATLGTSAMYANLFNGNTFVASTPVASNGTYIFHDVAGNTTYNVVISTVQATSASTPSSVLPAGWMSTGENIGSGAGNDGTANGMTPVTMGSANIGNVNFGVKQVEISGNVYDDVTGLTDNQINGTGTNAGGLYAMLINPSTNKVVAMVAVAADGSFKMTSVGTGNFNVAITKTLPVVGNTPPALSLPAAYVNTGEGITAPGDGTVNGLTAIIVTNADYSGIKFGINQPPVATATNVPGQANPGGTVSVSVPATSFAGTDPNSGTVTSLTLTSFPTNATSITVGTTTYYPNSGAIPSGCSTCAVFPGTGVVIPTNTSGQPNTAVSVDPVAGVVTVQIPFKVTDNAGLNSPVVTINMPFTTAAPGLSGTVYVDNDAMTGGANAGGNGATYTGGGLNAVLVNGTTVVAVSPVSTTNGTYSFSDLANNSYQVILSTATPTVGATVPATSTLPGSFVHVSATDATPTDGKTAVTISGAAVTGIDFGINPPPVATATNVPAQPNPGGTANAVVPVASFGGTDPNNGTVTSLTLTSFPTNATSITVGTTTYYPSNGAIPSGCSTCAVFPPAGVTIPSNTAGQPTVPVAVDPVAGTVTVQVPFKVTDNASLTSSTVTINMPFTPAPGLSGTVYVDNDGMTGGVNAGAGGFAYTGGGLNAVLVNGTAVLGVSPVSTVNGMYSFSDLANNTYNVILSTANPAVGSTAPTTSTLLTGYTHVSSTDTTPSNGMTMVVINSAAVTGIDFGINPPPVADTTTRPRQSNPGGMNSVVVPPTAFGGADSIRGVISAIKLLPFPANATSITINGLNYTSATFPAQGIIVPSDTNGHPTQVIKVDPIDGPVTVSIPYATIDNAGLQSQAQGWVKQPFADVPDLTPFLTIDPNVVHGNQQFDVRVRTYNVRPIATTGRIILFIPKNNKWTFTWNPTGDNFAGLPTSNASWTYQSNAAYHIWITDAVIAGNGSLSFGFTGNFTGSATNGKFPVTVQIQYPSGSEVYNGNNTDDEDITFFQF